MFHDIQALLDMLQRSHTFHTLIIIIMIFYCGLMVHITDTRTQKLVSYWFAIGCIFALFQCCTPKSSIGSDYDVKPKK